MIEYLLISDFCQMKILELNFLENSRSDVYTHKELTLISQKHNKEEGSRYTRNLKKNKTLYTYLDKFGNHIMTILNKKVYSDEKIFEILIKIGDMISEVDFENIKETNKVIPKIEKFISDFNKKINLEGTGFKSHSVTDHNSQKTDFLSKTPDNIRSVNTSVEDVMREDFRTILDEKEKKMKLYLFLFSGSLLIIFIGTLCLYRIVDA